MSKAIFLAVLGDAKFEARIGKLGRAAGRAAVERFLVRIARLHLELLSPSRDLLSLPHVLKNLRAKEEEVVREREKHRQPIGVGTDHKPEEQKGSRDPTEPLDLHRQD